MLNSELLAADEAGSLTAQDALELSGCLSLLDLYEAAADEPDACIAPAFEAAVL